MKTITYTNNQGLGLKINKSASGTPSRGITFRNVNPQSGNGVEK